MTEEDEYHVDFCVGVAHVANDGTRFHFVHVVAGDDVLIARGRDQQVHVADDFVQLQYAESIHAVNNNKRMTQFLRILIGNRRRFFFFFKMYFSLMKYFFSLKRSTRGISRIPEASIERQDRPEPRSSFQGSLKLL